MHRPGMAASQTALALTWPGGAGCSPYGPGPNHAGVPGAGKWLSGGGVVGAGTTAPLPCGPANRDQGSEVIGMVAGPLRPAGGAVGWPQCTAPHAESEVM